jgi:hypothetical protein
MSIPELSKYAKMLENMRNRFLTIGRKSYKGEAKINGVKWMGIRTTCINSYMSISMYNYLYLSIYLSIHPFISKIEICVSGG